MNYLLFLMLSLAFAAAECRPAQNKIDSTEADKGSNMKMQTKRVGDLEYKISFEKVSGTFLRFSYEVKNLSESNYLIYNRGTSLEMRRGTVFVEPQMDNGIELSQKRFFEPKDKNCPDREAPIYPAASWLKAKQTVKEEIGVSLPFRAHTPFSDCQPQTEMPKEVEKIRFCLGVAKVDSVKDIKTDAQGTVIVRGGENIGEQQFLCSDVIEMK